MLVIKKVKFILTKGKQNVNIKNVRKRHAGVAELADALDLGSSVTDVGVQVLSPAPISQSFRLNKALAYFFYAIGMLSIFYL